MPTQQLNTLQARRMARGWTAQQLAEQSGVPLSTIRKLEQHEHDPKLLTATALSRALELPVEAVFSPPVAAN